MIRTEDAGSDKRSKNTRTYPILNLIFILKTKITGKDTACCKIMFQLAITHLWTMV